MTRYLASCIKDFILWAITLTWLFTVDWEGEILLVFFRNAFSFIDKKVLMHRWSCNRMCSHLLQSQHCQIAPTMTTITLHSLSLCDLFGFSSSALMINVQRLELSPKHIHLNPLSAYLKTFSFASSSSSPTT